MNRWLKIKLYSSWFLPGIAIAILIFSLIPVFSDFYHTGGVNLVTLINISPGVSISLAFIAIGFALNSDIKMDINSNENFLRIVDKFEDMRIDLFQHNSRGDFSLIIRGCWKLRTYTKRAIKLYEMTNIERENQSQLFGQLEQLISWTAMPWRPISTIRRTRVVTIDPMRRRDVQNVLEICRYFRKINLNSIQEIRLESYIEFLEYILDRYY